MKRRHFIGLAGAATGYSVIVRAGGLTGKHIGEQRRAEIAKVFDTTAPAAAPIQVLAGEPHLALIDLACDVFVAGGGLAGVCAAVTAARHGARVVLVQDRARLGGNASSEVRMHVVGADCSGGRPGWRESGLIEELRLDDAVRNPHRCFELWDLLLYDKVMSEPNITLLLDSTLCGVETRDGEIRKAVVRCDKTEHVYRIEAKLFMDCTGDSRLALEAGAEMRQGREAKSEFNESLGLDRADGQTLGSSILFTARDYGVPVPFTPPAWARLVTKDQLQFRSVRSWEYGYWWVEWGGQLDTIRDNERIRFELLAIALGVWDYIKNSGDIKTSANWGMDWIGMIPGKRESRRIAGDHILTEHDLTGGTKFEDAVAMGGWPLDDHPPSGFDRPEEKPARQIKPAAPYQIPLRSLYSRNIRNLMMAGRNISATHVAFSSTRVMATCAVEGQAAGAAAALCARAGLTPRALRQDRARLSELQQLLLRDDQTVPGLRNTDPFDLARSARATASGALDGAGVAHVLNGLVRDPPGSTDNLWAAPLTSDGAWIELTWAEPRTISCVQITFDTGFQRPLALTAQNDFSRRMVRGPQPETARDYELSYSDPAGNRQVLVKVGGNHQRLNRHKFEPVKAKSIRITITATNGADTARVYEVRAYG